uniref:VWFA domain-containing protein n=1 Tax=Onchocerca volvulus TaxID=6282 RepID=A0A8R1TT53_ONCVO
MIQLLLAVVLITVCKAQYGEVAAPAPAPPLNYAPNVPEEIPYTSETSYPENEYGNVAKPVAQPETQLSPTQQHLNNVTCLLPPSQIPQQPSSTTAPPSSSPRTSRPTPRSRPQPPQTTRRTTRRPSVTTRRTTSSSRRYGSSRPTRTTRNQTSRSTRRPVDQTTQSGFRGCASAPDMLFVIDSTSSVRQFFEDHRAYIITIVKLILPEFDNETMIGVIEYSSPLRRQVKLPFTAHKNRAEIIRVIENIPFFAGITATGAALELALQVLQNRRSGTLTNVIVLTDGFSYDYVEQPSMMLHRLPNVRTFTATVTETWRQYELETIAGDEKRVFKGKDSARELAKALMSCDSGSRLPSSRRNNLFK